MTSPATVSQCCFCGNAIVAMPPDPVFVAIDLGDDARQDFAAHYRCLKRAMDASVPLFPLDLQE